MMQEGDQYYAHFLFQAPRLHMWRCLTYPQCIENMLKIQAFELMSVVTAIFVLKTCGAGIQCLCAAQLPPLDSDGGFRFMERMDLELWQWVPNLDAVVGWTFVFQSTMEQWTMNNDNCSFLFQGPTGLKRRAISSWSLAALLARQPRLRPRLRPRLAMPTFKGGLVHSKLHSMFGSTVYAVHCWLFHCSKSLQYDFVVLIHHEEPDLDTNKPCQFGLLNVLLCCTSRHHRLVDTEWFWPLTDWPKWPETREKQLGSHCLSTASPFWMKFLNNQHLSFRDNQCLGTATCCRWLSAKVAWQQLLQSHSMFHCSTVPLFWVSCCRSCCNISGVWTPHGFFQRLTSKLLAPKLLAPTFHLLQSLTSLLVPRFDDYIYIYIYHISNVLSKVFSHVFFEISSITLTWGGVMLQYFLMCNKSLTGAKQIWNFRFLNLWFCFFVAKISGKSKIKFPEANGGT